MSSEWKRRSRRIRFLFCCREFLAARQKEEKGQKCRLERFSFSFFSGNLINWLHKENKRELTRQYDISLLIFNFAAYGLILKFCFFALFGPREARTFLCNHVTIFNFCKTANNSNVKRDGNLSRNLIKIVPRVLEEKFNFGEFLIRFDAQERGFWRMWSGIEKKLYLISPWHDVSLTFYELLQHFWKNCTEKQLNL